jgi:type IV pilus assembly protein PilO
MRIKPQTQREQGMAAVVVISVLLAVLYYMQIHTPRAEELVVTTERVERLEAANDKAKAEMARGSIDALRAKAAQYAANLSVMRQLVPTGNEVPALLEQVSTAARRVNLDIGTVVPEPVIAGETFDTYRYKVSVVGDYHALGEFLGNVGSLTRIVAPMNMKLTPALNPAAIKNRQKPNRSVLLSEFELQTYVARSGMGANSTSVAQGGDVSLAEAP